MTSSGAPSEPADFRAAVDSLHAARIRREIEVGPIRPPQRLAPYSYAVGAEVRAPDEPGIEDIAVDSQGSAFGRLILLYDPAGQDAWDGTMRLVAYIQAEVEAALAMDPLLPEVTWSWLSDALGVPVGSSSTELGAADGAPAIEVTALGGTVTSTTSVRYGDIAGPPRAHQLELRASWTAVTADGLGGHLEAFCDVLASTAGLPPVGVTRAGLVMNEAGEADAPEVTPLLRPAGGVPQVLTSAAEFSAAAEALANGSGPIALDTERASGFRYSQRAYLIQIKRDGAGSFLLDPIIEPEALQPVIEALDGPEWVLHAADQDLPCLRELGFVCRELYDTELAGRLLGLAKVNLAAMVVEFLGLGLQKGHGAADWSRRPLPDDWLNYAALDVEVLVELRDAMDAALVEAGKNTWAREEFAYVLGRPPAPPRSDRWRRTSNIHTIKNRRTLAAVRELWSTREAIAERRDVAPGRVLPDSAIVNAATTDPTTIAELTRLPVFGGPRQRRQAGTWLHALERARELSDDELPPRRTATGGLPPPNRWEQSNPAAGARLVRVRGALADLSTAHSVPTENLLAPHVMRQLCWDGLPGTPTTQDVDARLAADGARSWQRTLCAAPIAAAFAEAAAALAQSGNTESGPAQLAN